MKNFLVVIFFLFLRTSAQAQCNVISSFSPSKDTIILPGTTINFTSTSVNESSLQWSYMFGIPDGSLETFSPNFYDPGVYTIRLIAKNNACSDTSYSKVIVSGSELPGKSYQAFYGQELSQESPKVIIPTADSGFLLGAIMNSPSSGDWYQHLYLVKISEEGCIQWSARFAEPVRSTMDISKAVELSDGSFIVVGATGTNTTYVIRLMQSGEIMWQRGFNNYVEPVEYTGIKEVEGGFLLSGSGSSGTTGKAALIKFNLQGKVLWSKSFYNTGIAHQFANIMEVWDNYVYLASSLTTYDNAYLPLKTEAFITKIDPLNGDILWVKTYTTGVNINPYISFRSIRNVGNSLMLSYMGDDNLNYCYIDSSGNVKESNAIQCNAPISRNLYTVFQLKNGDLEFVLAGKESIPWQPYFVAHTVIARIGSDKQVRWLKNYQPSNEGLFKDVALSVNDRIAGITEEAGRIEHYDSYDYNINLIKVAEDGNIPSCNKIIGNGYTLNVYNAYLGSALAAWLNTATLNLESKSPGFTPVECKTSFMYYCPPYYKGCSRIDLYGQASLCNLSKTYTYTAVKGTGCTNKVNFETDPSAIKIVGSTDSTITVMFLRTGKQMIRVWLNGNCSTLRDSLSIDVQDKQKNSFTIGNDFSLCPGASKKISAGKNYIAYKWQDGSADSVFVAKDSGYYYVTVTDSCSFDYTDSIYVSLNAAIPVFIGNDIQICKGDTAFLQAPAGYQSYQWLPTYHLLLQDSLHVAVFPQKDTSYSVTLKNSEGCSGADTVHVKVNAPTAFSLGADTSFCKGSALTLQATASFTNYTWNDGSNNATYNASATGTYYLEATDANGCLFSDSIGITVNENPGVSHGPDKNICLGQTVTLGLTQTSADLTLYTWQDGSSQPRLTTGALGTYYVEVWNNYSCSSSDTIQLLAYDPLPENFLQPYDSLCENESMQITAAAGYTVYNWSNGSSAATTTINAPGIYTLRVTDAKGCTGSDSISIYSKQCLHGIFFPSGFSPNGDGKNDLFKPVVKIALEQYHFVIYNRFGQKVFETSDPQKGWNGSYNDIAQPGNTVYVWTCRYQQQGQQPQVNKGTITLLR